MSHEEQLAWEARAGRPAAGAAFAAAILAIAGGVYLPLALSGSPDGDYELLKAADTESSDFIVAGVLQALGLLLLIPVLLYLFRATRYRNPRLMPAAAILAALGGLVLAAVMVWGPFERVDIAHSFFPDHAHGSDLDEVASDYLQDEYSPVLQGVGLAGQIGLAFAVIMIALNAMRAGLLSRFMGTLGIFVGVMVVIPFVPVVQLFWLGAVGLLFLNRWPGGRGPAWQTGEAIPWPGAAEQREEIERRRAEREGVQNPPPEPEEAQEPQEQRPTSRKRRKKR